MEKDERNWIGGYSPSTGTAHRGFHMRGREADSAAAAVLAAAPPKRSSLETSQNFLLLCLHLRPEVLPIIKANDQTRVEV
jgi:hypothetical protein